MRRIRGGSVLEDIIEQNNRKTVCEARMKGCRRNVKVLVVIKRAAKSGIEVQVKYSQIW